MPRTLVGVILLAVITLAPSARAQDRQIVTDPVLNETLLAFEQSFPTYIAAHAALTSGASEPVELSGSKGKVTYTLTMSASYAASYQSIRFDPTSPIGATSFHATLAIASIAVTGDAAVSITRVGNTYDLTCPDSSFVVAPATFVATVTLASDGRVSVDDASTDITPSSIVASVPRLDGRSAGKTNADDELDGVVRESPSALVSDAIAASLERPPGAPNRNTLSKAKAGVTASARQSASDVAKIGRAIGNGNGAALVAAGSSPCGGTVSATAALAAADLAAISVQAQSQGFPAAIDAFAVDLRAIVPTLDPPSQAAVQTLAAGLETATSPDGPGGATITSLERATLTGDFTNVAMSTGITSLQIDAITADLNAVFTSLSGVSTAQLRADLQTLASDVRECASAR